MNKLKISVIVSIAFLLVALCAFALTLYNKNNNTNNANDIANQNNSINSENDVTTKDNNMNLQFQLEGKTYTLGDFTMQTLIDNGWTPSLQYANVKNLNDFVLESRSGKGFTFLNSNYPDFTLEATANNFTYEEIPILTCPVTTIYFDGLYSLREDTLLPTLTLSKGLTWNATLPDILKVYGNPTSNSDNESLTWEHKETKKDFVINKELWVMVDEENGLSRIRLSLHEE